MRALFRGFDRRGVRYLLISGQATVLYGAAHFSQDVDLWLDPARSNVRAFAGVLERLHATIHKLTPPLTLRNLRRGHGFHFIVPDADDSPLYLDVMGQPPRVGRFAECMRTASRVKSPWGTIPVVSIEDLVEIKKTNRPADYDVISRLALIRLSREPRPDARLLRWAARNIFSAEDLWSFACEFAPAFNASTLSASPALRALHRIARSGRRPRSSELARAAALLARAALRLQHRGRRYWLPIIAELRRMRADGVLLAEGAPVRVNLVL